jgi:hypothetical protein
MQNIKKICKLMKNPNGNIIGASLVAQSSNMSPTDLANLSS